MNMAILKKLNKEKTLDAEKDKLSATKIEQNPLTKLSKEPNKVPAPDPLATMEYNPLKALDKQNKEKAKKEAADEAMTVRCKLCNKKIIPIRECTGHGGGGGYESKSGSNLVAYEAPTVEGSSAGSKSKSDELFLGSQVAGLSSSGKATDEELEFDLERMMELFSFLSDTGKGILTIRAKPGYSLDDEKEMQRYLAAINAAFEDFKNELKKKGFSVEGFISTLDKNDLVISIPSPDHYDAFINELHTNKLLPTMSPTLDDEEQHVATSPTPFAKTPSPSVRDEEDKEEKDRYTSSLSPFPIDLKPRD